MYADDSRLNELHPLAFKLNHTATALKPKQQKRV
jgi:hypothetical protein